MLSQNGKATWLGRLIWGDAADANAIAYALLKAAKRRTQVLQSILKRIYQMSAATDRVQREVGETLTSVNLVLARLGELNTELAVVKQQLADAIANDADDSVFEDVSNKLDEIQAQIAAALPSSPLPIPEIPVEEPAVEEPAEGVAEGEPAPAAEDGEESETR